MQQCLKLFGRCNSIHGGFQRLLLYSTSTTSLTKPTAFFAEYMVDNLGFSQKEALSVSTKFFKGKKVIDCRFFQTANSVLDLFKKHGFDETQLRKIVYKHPELLSCNAESTLIPKFQFLQEQGFSESDIIRVVSANPSIFKFSVDSSILPAVQILRQVMGSDDYVIRVLSKLGNRKICSIVKNLLPNVALLDSYGISIEFIRKHLLSYPMYYMQNPLVFKEVTIKVEEKLGVTRDSTGFLYGIDLMFGRSEESLLSRCRIFKSFGWTQSEIETFMMKNVNCFGYSEERIKKRLDFLMNELQVTPAYLTNRGRLFCLSLEKRVLPRHKIVLILKEKGLLNQNACLYSAITMAEPLFLKRYVLPFKEVHEAYAKHTGCSLKMLSQGNVVISS